MYFYTNKIDKNEAQQNVLLEMCSDTCFIDGNGANFHGIGTIDLNLAFYISCGYFSVAFLFN